MTDGRRVIDSFTDKAGYGFLSNFYKSTIYIDGVPWPSVEHAYQGHKTIDPVSREMIRKAKTPGEAKKLGQCVTLRPDWEDVKIDLMRMFLRKKFENPFLAPLLLKTGDAKLVHGNNWNDTYFGVCRGVGQNWLGILLEEIRDELSGQ